MAVVIDKIAGPLLHDHANDHAKQHAITSTTDHTSTATSGKMLKADANGLPVDATNTDAEVAAAVTAAAVPKLGLGQCYNLGITVAAGVFTICGSDGSALSASNIGYACVRSTTAGQSVILSYTANVTFNDGSHASPSYPAGLGLGITETVNWASNAPFSLYIYNHDNTSANSGFFWCRKPHLTTTPAGGSIHDFDAAGATDTEDSIVLIRTHTDDAASVPCTRIGCFQQTWVT